LSETTAWVFSKLSDIYTLFSSLMFSIAFQPAVVHTSKINHLSSWHS